MLTARTGQASLAINPWIFAVAAINAILAVGIGVLIAPIVWSVDGDRNLAAARALMAGTFGQDHGYLYTPLAAALTIPAVSVVPYGLAVAGWLVARIAVLFEGVRREVSDLSPIDRILVAVAAIAFVPTLHDLLLGNVSILITAAVAVVAWSGDGYLAGLPLGLVLATVPKPALIPILIWMLLFRRRALLSAVGSAAFLSAAAFVILGASTYGAWFQVLLHPYYLGTNQTGNLALGAMLPALLAWPLIGATVVATVVALRRGEAPGFIACLCAGLLIAPYTMAYGAVLLLLAVRPLSRVSPTPTFALAATGSIGVIVFMPIWVGAILAATLAVPRAAWTPLRHGAAA
ncbi:MAG: glycosyltransferase 87 family protein [Candidatus Limnocylindrales bacterium]